MERTMNIKKFFGISVIGCLCITLAYYLSWKGLAWLISGVYNSLSPNAATVFATLYTVGFSLIFYMSIRAMMKGRLRNGFTLKNAGKGILIPLPYLIFFGVFNSLGLVVMGGISNPVMAIVMALAPAIAEEVVCRNLLISFVMRKGATTKNIVTAFVLSGLLFSAMHLTNLLNGAGMGNTISQVCNTFGFGCILAVTFLRSGSILPCIIAHFVLDLTCFLHATVAKTGGVLVGDDKINWFIVVVGGISFVYAVIMLVVNMKKIKEVWAK